MFFRGILVGLLSGSVLLASPPLTKIQDVLYKADGTRFSGIASISWRTFEAGDTSNIGTQSITVRIVDGNLRVELVPNSGAVPPAPYVVKYNSDGKAQFEENWVVPPSATPLRVRDVRVAVQTAPVEGGGLPAAIQESDVIGLVADLQARPTKGTAFFPGRVVYINATGSLEAAAGDPSDCVRVDGSSGPCGEGLSLAGFADLETPSGVVDGANAFFALADTPSPSSSLTLFRNGILQKIDQDFHLSGSQVEFLAAGIPQPGDTLLASYRTAAPTAGDLLAGRPEVLCSNTGLETSSEAPEVLGSCAVAAGQLKAGDRLEIRFDYAHQGTSADFTVELRYGQTPVFTRTVSAAEPFLTGRAEAAVYAAGAQLSSQTWGVTAAQVSGIVGVSGAPDAALSIDFLGGIAQGSADSVALRNFSVIRYAE